VLVTRGDLAGAMALYEQSLAIKDGLGDVRGKSATLHAMANVLVTRGDLAGAMALYEQSLAIKDGLGDVRGKSATLANMAVVQFRQGEHERALTNARTSLQLLQAMGATPDAAQVAQIIEQMEAARSGGAATGPDDRSPARLVGALVAATVRALRGQLPRESVQAELHRLAARDDLQPVVTALQAALDNRPTAAANLPATAEALLAQGTPAERADALVGIGNLAAQLGDPATELQTRRQAVAAFRQAGEDRETLVALSIALHNLAIAYINQDDPVVAIPLLEEVVLMLDGQNAHPDLEQDRSLLEALRRRAAGEAEPGLREAVAAWVEAGRDEEQFAGLLNAICNLYVTAVREGDPARRTALADALEHVCAVRPLPIPGAHDFLQLLQLLLHADPTTTDEADRLRAALPTALAQALATMEGLISGEADTASPEAAEPEAMEEELAAAAQAMLGQLSPEQQAELAVVSQVWALLEQVFPLLRDPDVTVTERARHAEGLERAADQFAAGADAGSPRLVAAETLQRVAGWLRGTPPDPDALPQPYRNLIKRLI
jgi:tetratricopeptide (TPR) repeat protein